MNKPSKKHTLRYNDDTWTALTEEAERRGVSRSWLINKLGLHVRFILSTLNLDERG